MELALEAHGVTAEFLAKQLADELQAKETKIVKVDGNVDGRTKRGVTVLSKIVRGKIVVATVLAIDMRSWNTQQKARMDAHKLCGHYPAERLDVTMNEHEKALEDLE
ncbi:MAG: hypothetical protein KKE73_10885 [Proteobacteria bacterium]|nr:hypothetical protein [Pseudomonadota bacterium]